MIKIFGIKSCGSVKKALAFFNKHAVEYTFHDLKAIPIDAQQITRWSTVVPMNLLLNTKGTTYKSLGLKNYELTDEDKIGWMAQHNLLIKRPIIEYHNQVIVGFDESQYEGLFLS